MPKVVFDTVVFVRSLLNPSNIWGSALFRWAEQYQLVVSRPILIEILEVLQRPELTSKFRSLPGMDTGRVIALLGQAEAVEVGEIPAVSRDVKDDKFLATALAAGADYLVTEDEDLLVLGKYGRTSIVTMVGFLKVLREQSANEH